MTLQQITRKEMLAVFRKGWHMIPLLENSKAPNLPKGHKFLTEAPTTEDYKNFKFSNYGIITGAISDIVVLDIDGEAGDNTLQELDRWPYHDPTPQVDTPNGRHIYYQYNPKVKTNIGALGEGVDIRSTGAYVVGPGSIVEGEPYRWVEGYDLSMPLLSAPDWLYGEVWNDEPKVYDNDDYYTIGEKVVEGERNTKTYKLASYFVAKDMSKGMVLDMIRHFNASWVEPPLTDDEVEKICDSAERWRNQ